MKFNYVLENNEFTRPTSSKAKKKKKFDMLS